MNKELDELLCLLDGKITAYRMKHPYHNSKIEHDNTYMQLIQIQLEIQKMWSKNSNSGTMSERKTNTKGI